MRLSRLTLAAALAAAALAAAVFALPGCATIDKGAAWWQQRSPAAETTPVVKPDPATPTDAYTITDGKRVLKTLNVAAGAWMAYGYTPGRDGSADTEDVAAFACADDACDTWAGGNSSTFSVRVNAYDAGAWETKVYGTAGYCGEPKLSHPWVKGQTYAVKLEVLPDRVRLTVDGKSVEQECAIPAKVTLGYGWPPSKRSASGTISGVTRGAP